MYLYDLMSRIIFKKISCKEAKLLQSVMLVEQGECIVSNVYVYVYSVQGTHTLHRCDEHAPQADLIYLKRIRLFVLNYYPQNQSLESRHSTPAV